MKINSKMSIGEIVQNHPKTVEVFFKYGMHCLGCAASHFENLEQGCEAHGIDSKKMIVDLNKAIEKPAKKAVKKK
jgi:hybrid cluster-associated redox disulfide protein